ncbi:hypothetical protein [Massilia niastensis]|nr:hypothetical protein [Massilia niastensis]
MQRMESPRPAPSSELDEATLARVRDVFEYAGTGLAAARGEPPA